MSGFTMPLVFLTLACIIPASLYLRRHPRKKGEPLSRAWALMAALTLLGAAIAVINLVLSLLLR